MNKKWLHFRQSFGLKLRNFYWAIWGDSDLNLTREESRRLRYGKADKRTEQVE